jgi:hypothetical protein
MTSRKNALGVVSGVLAGASSCLLLAGASTGLLAGCDSKSSSTASAPPPPPPPPPSKASAPRAEAGRGKSAPAGDRNDARGEESDAASAGGEEGGAKPTKGGTPVNVKDVLAGAGVDERVQFPQERSVPDASLVTSAAKLSSALAKGDSGAFGKLLTADARGVLDQLVNSGQWEEATGKIEAVRVVKLSTGGELQLALQEPGEAYVLAWKGTKKGEEWLFAADVASDEVRTRAAEFDGGVAATTSTAKKAEPVEAKPKAIEDGADAAKSAEPVEEAPADEAPAPAPATQPSKGRSPRQQAPGGA